LNLEPSSLLESEKLEAIAEFAAGAGHEINNPLTVISGRAQLLLRDEADPERRRSLALIVAQATRVHEMIADMMLFARPPQPEFQRTELVAMVDALVADLTPQSRRQETTLVRVEPSEPVFVEVDPVQLTVAIRAIVQNAFEAIQTGGRIEVVVETVASGQWSVASEEPYAADIEPQTASLQVSKSLNPQIPAEARIRIRDDGPGIQPEERRHLFDPFYSARQAGRGLGMGLAKAWRIVTSHSGRIEVESEPGRGATFTIYLPSPLGRGTEGEDGVGEKG
jgi:signal transduction histidine kinase